jgi:hypothetical protein
MPVDCSGSSVATLVSIWWRLLVRRLCGPLGILIVYNISVNHPQVDTFINMPTKALTFSVPV